MKKNGKYHDVVSHIVHNKTLYFLDAQENLKDRINFNVIMAYIITAIISFNRHPSLIFVSILVSL